MIHHNKKKPNLTGTIEKLGIPDDVEPLEVVVPEIKFDDENPEKDITSDYQFARRKLISLIATGDTVLTHVMTIVRRDCSARLIESISLLIKTIGDQTDKLISLQEKIKKIRPLHEDQKLENDSNSIKTKLTDLVNAITNNEQ